MMAICGRDFHMWGTDGVVTLGCIIGYSVCTFLIAKYFFRETEQERVRREINEFFDEFPEGYVPTIEADEGTFFLGRRHLESPVDQE